MVLRLTNQGVSHTGFKVKKKNSGSSTDPFPNRSIRLSSASKFPERPLTHQNNSKPVIRRIDPVALIQGRAAVFLSSSTILAVSLLFSAIKFSMVVLTLIPSIVVGTVTMNSVAVV